VNDLLSLPDFARLVRAGADPVEWASQYERRKPEL
jgi:hypothetical protein